MGFWFLHLPFTERILFFGTPVVLFLTQPHTFFP